MNHGHLSWERVFQIKMEEKPQTYPLFSCPNSEISKHQSFRLIFLYTHTHTYPFQFSHKLRNPNIFKAFNIYFSFQTFSENPNIDPRKADIIYLFDKSKLTKSELSANVNLFSNRAAGKPDTCIKNKMKQ